LSSFEHICLILSAIEDTLSIVSMTTALWGKDIDICQCVCIISVDMIPSEKSGGGQKCYFGFKNFIMGY